MPLFKITGKNKQGDKGSWDITAKDKEDLRAITKGRGLKIETIDGKTEGVKNGVRSKRQGN